MPSILNLKFKGNKSFVAFSNLNDAESLTKTWKVCTKVASYLEQGQRLENLSWRLWHLQSLMVDSDNAKSKREFKKLSRVMGDKLDKEKGRSIEELEAPDFKRTQSIEMIQQRAVEKERNREASQNAQPGTIKRMQFTFSVDQPVSGATAFAAPQKPDNKPSPDFIVTRQQHPARNENDMVVDGHNDHTTTSNDHPAVRQPQPQPQDFLRFPSLFSNDFGPSALLYAAPTLKNSADYGEDHLSTSAFNNDSFSIVRPTIELPLDDIINNVDGDFGQLSNNSTDDNTLRSSPGASSSGSSSSSSDGQQAAPQPTNHFSHHYSQDVAMPSAPAYSSFANHFAHHHNTTSISSTVSSDADSEDDDSDRAHPQPHHFRPGSTVAGAAAGRKRSAPGYTHHAPTPTALPKTVAPSKINSLYASAMTAPPARQTTPRPHLTVRTSSAAASATATVRTPTGAAAGGEGGRSSTAPGGIKAECSNCGATHTPLWRRGLNDELNCNACGLYCKLHKRPRPKSMRNTHGEGRSQTTQRTEAVDVMAQCYNCHTTATPLWRKDDEGKTVCNACGLYYKLHGSPRPISMKSDVIRKRSRHDARRGGFGGPPETPSASPGVSRRASPDRESSPTFAPDSSTMAYEDQQPQQPTRQHEYSSNQSELLGALGNDQSNLFHSYQFPFHSQSQQSTSNDPLPFASGEFDLTSEMLKSPRSAKRRRMSTDSMSEPPSSAVSFGSYDGYSSSTSTSATSAHSSQHSSIDWGSFAYLPFQHEDPPPSLGHSLKGGSAHGSNNDGHRGGGDANGPSTPLFHPPMLPPSMLDFGSGMLSAADEESMFSMYLHPPMTIPEEMGGGEMGLVYPMPAPGQGQGAGRKGEYDVNMRIY